MEKTVESGGTVGPLRGGPRQTPTSPTSVHSLPSPTGYAFNGVIIYFLISYLSKPVEENITFYTTFVVLAI